jgi:hypothetical protein
MKKVMLFWLIGSVVALYRTFVIENLWNWFAASALHIPEISFWGMYGLVLLIGVFTNNHGQKFEEGKRERMGMALRLKIVAPVSFGDPGPVTALGPPSPQKTGRRVGHPRFRMRV